MGLPCEDAADAAPSSGEAQQRQQQAQAPPSAPGSPGGSAEPRRWYCLVKLDPAGVAAPLVATEEDAEALAGLLTPQQALAARSPALSVEEAPDSPEQSASTSRPLPPPTKPGGPCDHCGTHGALPPTP
jgi:hypothetical protein